jgi:hypothetical protein
MKRGIVQRECECVGCRETTFWRYDYTTKEDIASVPELHPGAGLLIMSGILLLQERCISQKL